MTQDNNRGDWSKEETNTLEQTNKNGDIKSYVEGTNGLKVSPVDESSGNSDSEDQEGKDAAEDLRCGLGCFSPNWLQIFASKQAFLVIFCITWVLQGMYYTYFVSVITTIEKLFQIQSKTTGIIMSATEIGQIGSSLLLTYFGGQGHRPKWIAWGMVLFAVSSFTCSLPHFIFGDQLIHANEVRYSGASFSAISEPNICRLRDPFDPMQNVTTNSSSVFQNSAMCKEEYLKEQINQSRITKIVMAIFFISLLGVGMGQTAVYTLGIPYIDDNVATRESPLYFAITIGVRILGPAMGFMLGSLCTRLYANLSVDPQFPPTDPRWVGAWWLGLVLVSSMLMLSSFAMFSFPKRLKSYKGRPPRNYMRGKNPSLKDFPAAVKRLLRNDILMFRTASSVLHILPIAGLYTFLPKYLESQFRLAAHSANMISGVGGILVMGLGIILSGVFILRVKPNARFVAAWIAFTAIIYSIGMCILMIFGCPMDDFAGLEARRAGEPDFKPVCNTTCQCNLDTFSPICGSDGKTYFSACHAGCRNHTVHDGKVVQFSDCQCIQDTANNSNSFNNNSNSWTTTSQTTTTTLSPGYLFSMPPTNNEVFSTIKNNSANIGYCSLKCSNFVPYILLFSMFVFIHSTSEVGSMLLILRCVDPRDKAMALGLIQFAIGLFGNVPCPIVYGAVVDYACLVWDKACGKQGACWLYDTNLFRKFYHGTTGAILLCAFLVDIVVWYKAGSINFVDETPTTNHGIEQNNVDELSPIKQSRSETSV